MARKNSGNEFQALGPATENEDSAKRVLTLPTIRSPQLAERRRLSLQRVHSSVRQPGSQITRCIIVYHVKHHIHTVYIPCVCLIWPYKCFLCQLTRVSRNHARMAACVRELVEKVVSPANVEDRGLDEPVLRRSVSIFKTVLTSDACNSEESTSIYFKAVLAWKHALC